MKINPLRMARYYYLRFKRLRDDPKVLARGAALGLFIGIMPIMPFKSLLIVTITFVFPCSMLATFIACTAVCNPFTYLPLYYASWLVGDFILPGLVPWIRLKGEVIAMNDAGLKEAVIMLANIGVDSILVLLAGGFALAIPFAMIGYFLFLLFFEKVKKNRLAGLQKKEQNVVS